MKKIKIANQPVVPFPAMIVGAMVNDNPTYTTVGAGGCADIENVLCVSLKTAHYITNGIVESGCFSINIPHAELVKETDFCGIVSGKKFDKSALFTSFFDESGNAPLIEECRLYFLCNVCDSKRIKGSTMFFGDIVAVYANEDCLTSGKPDPIKIDPIIMMGTSYCAYEKVVGSSLSEGKKLNHYSENAV